MSSDYAIDDPTTTETASPPASPAPRRRLCRSASSQPARGILKNSNSTTRAATSNGNALVWDEGNLALNELQKDSTMKVSVLIAPARCPLPMSMSMSMSMTTGGGDGDPHKDVPQFLDAPREQHKRADTAPPQISEPKTPYVRYDAETDTVMDLDKIPGFELGQADAVAEGDEPTSPVHTTPPSPGTSSRRGSESNSRRGSESSEKMVKVERPSSAHGEDDDNDDDDDELADEETLAHRKQFAQKRGGHYRNEAEAMKRAQAMLAEEDDDSSDPDAARPSVPPMPTSGLAQSHGTTEEEEA